MGGEAVGRLYGVTQMESTENILNVWQCEHFIKESQCKLASSLLNAKLTSFEDFCSFGYFLNILTVYTLCHFVSERRASIALSVGKATHAGNGASSDAGEWV